jgi:hypothetical protein
MLWLIFMVQEVHPKGRFVSMLGLIFLNIYTILKFEKTSAGKFVRVLCDVNVVQEYIWMFPKKVPFSS